MVLWSRSIPSSYKYILTLLVLLTGFSISSVARQSYNITAFGTNTITSEEILEDYSELLDTLLTLHTNDRELYLSERDKFADLLKSKGDFSFVNVYRFRSYSGNISFIIDFVERKDSVSRLTYRSIQLESLDDPNRLIAEWDEYEALSFELFEAGEINDMSCPVIHCIWSFNHEKLQPFLPFFDTNAVSYKNELIRILNFSDDATFRAAAAFLLAHASIEPQELVDILMPSIHDPESVVRNNSMRVIYYAVRAQSDLNIDLDKVIQAFDFPSFTDRNKVIVILRSLPLDNLTKDQLTRLLPILLEVLDKKDAHNYRSAHTVLKNISGKEFPQTDIAAWREWITMKLSEQ